MWMERESGTRLSPAAPTQKAWSHLEARFQCVFPRAWAHRWARCCSVSELLSMRLVACRRRHSGLTVASGARSGAVTLIQRFGSALNVNIHLHMLFLYGAYTFRGTRAIFHRARRAAC